MSNLVVNTTDTGLSGASTAIFPKFDGTLKDLTVDTVTITGTSAELTVSYCAVLVGQNSHPGTIQNCTVRNATVNHTHSGSSYGIVGLLVGANHGHIDGCIVAGTITATFSAGTSRIGGICGLQTGGTQALEQGYAEDSTATVNITVNGSGTTLNKTGGICGEFQCVSTIANYITNCHWVGT